MGDEMTIQDQIEAARNAAAVEDETAAVAEQADAGRRSPLDDAKARCEAECGQVAAALSEATDQRERANLITLAEQVHAAHADDLAQAYLEFSGQRAGESSPASPGHNDVEAHVVVSSEDPGGAEPSDG